jgi:hypothetical protein
MVIYSVLASFATCLLLACVYHVSSRNLSFVHQVVDTLKLAQPNSLEWRLDNAFAEELNGFSGVLSVPDVRTLDGDHLDDRLKDRGAEVGSSGQTDGDDCAVGTDVLMTC